MVKFLERQNLPKLRKYEIENLNRLILIMVTAIIKKFPPREHHIQN